MKTKHLHLALSGILFLFYAGQTFSSHIIGSSITYQYTGTNQYLLSMKLYRDCNGIPAPGTVTICYHSPTTGISGSVILNPITGTGIEMQPSPCVSGNGTSTCSGGTNFGMQEWIYQGPLTLPQASSDWILSYSDCCRNAAITTLSNASGSWSYIYTKLDNLNFPVNSSPQFTTPPFAQYCLNLPATYSFSCSDPDGDSLVYLLFDVEQGSGCPATPYPLVYTIPFSATNPVSSSTPLVFDATTGSLTFTPPVLEIAVIGMVVQEYRNGILIGEVKRDDEISVVNGVMFSNYMTGKIFKDNNMNQVYDSGDQPLHGTIIEALPGPMYTSSNSSGDYAMPCQFGAYTTTIPALPLYHVVSPASHSANFSLTFQTDANNNFALSTPVHVDDLRVMLTGNNNIRTGTNTTLRITYINIGTAPINGSVDLVYDSNFVYLSSSVNPDSISGHTLTWNFAALPTLIPVNIDITMHLSAAIPLNTTMTSACYIQPMAGDSNPADNSDMLNQLVVASFDPNAKSVEPKGGITTTQISAGLYLDYTVYFQNTGNAAASTVIIIDTLDQNLNIPTLEVLCASHNYTWIIRGKGILEFRFDNIMLPDSNTNELLSHGFVRYRIKPKGNLVQGNKMTNIAYIIFDNNIPVITNFTSTTVLNPVSTAEWPVRSAELLIFPNPVNDVLHIEMKNNTTTFIHIQLFNTAGILVETIENRMHSGYYKKQTVLSQFPKGLYFLKFATDKAFTVRKILIE